MQTTSSKNLKRKKWLFGIITILFFFWGLANNMTDTMLAAFRQILNMSETQSSVIQFAFYFAYFCFAIPAALFIKSHSYKSGIILGVLIYAGGTMLFFPAAEFSSYVIYLLAIYVMAGGCSVLETVANPYILSMADSPADSIRNLNLAQSFNPFGSLLGIIASQNLVLVNLQAHIDSLANIEIVKEELDSVSIIYALVGQMLLVFMVILLFMNVPAYGGNMSSVTFGKQLRKVFSRSRFSFGVVAIFFYLGAQVGVWGYIIHTAMQLLGQPETHVSQYYPLSIMMFAVARFLFTYLMKFFQASKLLLFASIMAIICTLGVIFGSGMFSVVSLVAISFFMSLMFPTIFGSALVNTGVERQLGGAILIMAIVGGAVIPIFQTMVSEKLGIQSSFLVPAFCFVVVLGYSLHLYLLDKDHKLVSQEQ